MKQKILNLIVLLFLPFILFSQRYAHYDSDRLQKRWVDYQMEMAKFEDLEVQSMEQKEKEAKDLSREFEEAQNANKFSELRSIQRKTNNLDQKYSEKLNVAFREAQSRIQKKLANAITQVADKNNLDGIYELAGPILLYGDSKYDLTLELLAILNKQDELPASTNIFDGQRCASVSFASVIQNWEYYQIKQAIIQELKSDLQDKIDDYEYIRQKYERGKITINSAEKQLDPAMEEIENIRTDIEKLTKETNEEINTKYTTSLEKMASDENFDFIFDADELQDGSEHSQIDITQKFLEIINQ